MVLTARNTSGMLIELGQPSQQYLQEVQPISGISSMIALTSSRTRRSSSLKGSNAVNVERLSRICSSFDMPERIVITPGREATKRKAYDATALSGLTALSFPSSSGFRLASVPPLAGSITIIGIFLSSRILYSAPDWTIWLFQSM